MFRSLKIGFDPSARNPISATPTTPSSNSRHYLICGTPHSLIHPLECVSSPCTIPDSSCGTDLTISSPYTKSDKPILAPMSTSPKRRASCRAQVLGAQDLTQREGWCFQNLTMSSRAGTCSCRISSNQGLQPKGLVLFHDPAALVDHL